MRTSLRAAALAPALLALSIACSSGGGSSPPPPPPASSEMALSDVALSFTAEVGADPGAKAVTVTNAGGGSLAAPTTTVSYGAGSAWLETAVTGSSPYQVTVQPRVAGLAAGSYGATVTLASAGATNSPLTFTVSLTVTASAPALALSSSSLTFTAPVGGAAPSPRTVAVSNVGAGTLAGPTTSIAYGSGAGWLTATPSGSAPYAISVQPSPTGLAAGTYHATVSVASTGASNSPRTFEVSFTVVDPGGAQPAMQLAATALSFEAAAGGANPAAQTIGVSNLGGGTLAAPTASIAYASGAGWLDATVSGAAAPYTVRVQPMVGALGAGTYHATVSLSSPGAANTPQTFAVSFTVTAPPTMALSKASLAFTATFGAPSPGAQVVAVSNVGGGTLAAPSTSIAYDSGSGWLATTVIGTSAPFDVSVRPATTSLAVGSYSATVTVSSAGATNTPRTFGVTLAVVAPPAACKAATQACTSNGECCSSICNGAAGCSPSDFCGEPGTPCGSDSDCCSMNCPNAGSAGATCQASACSTAGTSCTAATASSCCSGVCGADSRCAALPPGPTNSTCTTLGERCSAPLECCSHNCQGATATTAGWCAPAYTCNAPGDVCARPEDCCSGLCALPATPGQPGRCDDASGGCGQDGVPCDNDAGCCTRLCVDLGSGTKVCQPAGGCRMTGNYCDSTEACCNINHLVPRPQWISCTADHTCDNGGSCNPPGNICGASTDVNASQNCCNGKKDVCKPDSNRVLRCFGGQTTDCPAGWDAANPLCCIVPGDICQFRDQCCDGAPCVPDATGVLRCSAGSDACVARGDACTAASPDPCCEGTSCNENTGKCESTTTCLGDGASCSTTPATPAESCCSGLCEPSTPGGTTGTCATCSPNGNGCSVDSQCCSGSCDPDSHFCVAPCVGSAGTCTVDADCCSGLACDVAPGDTSGTCSAGGTTCAVTGQTCALDTDCCNVAAGDTCVAGVCTAPATCSSASQACTLTGNECCSGLSCNAMDQEGGVIPCDGSAGQICFCDAGACVSPPATCGGANGVQCCPGSTCVIESSPLFPCPDSETPCVCSQTFSGG